MLITNNNDSEGESQNASLRERHVVGMEEGKWGNISGEKSALVKGGLYSMTENLSY